MESPYTNHFFPAKPTVYIVSSLMKFTAQDEMYNRQMRQREVSRKQKEPKKMENRKEKVKQEIKRENVWDMEKDRWANQREMKGIKEVWYYI